LAYICQVNEQQHAMNTTCTNSQIVSLINRAFDADGMLVSKGKRKNQAEARAILAENNDKYSNDPTRTYGVSDMVCGYDVHTSLLIMAYPNRTL
jgi:hypothetical protein